MLFARKALPDVPIRGQPNLARRREALDPADYSPVTIKNSISITGVEGAGIDTKSGTAVNLNIGLGSAEINLANLVIQNVSGSGTAGINGAITGGFGDGHPLHGPEI